MLDFEIEELNQAADWREVLAAYQSAYETAKASAEDFDGWLPRIMSVEGLEDEDLPRLHGKLIALGFLKFQLAGRGTGVVYQISPAGREALANLAFNEASCAEDAADDEEDASILELANAEPLKRAA